MIQLSVCQIQEAQQVLRSCIQSQYFRSQIVKKDFAGEELKNYINEIKDKGYLRIFDAFGSPGRFRHVIFVIKYFTFCLSNNPTTNSVLPKLQHQQPASPYCLHKASTECYPH